MEGEELGGREGSGRIQGKTRTPQKNASIPSQIIVDCLTWLSRRRKRCWKISSDSASHYAILAALPPKLTQVSMVPMGAQVGPSPIPSLLSWALPGVLTPGTPGCQCGNRLSRFHSPRKPVLHSNEGSKSTWKQQRLCLSQMCVLRVFPKFGHPKDPLQADRGDIREPQGVYETCEHRWCLLGKRWHAARSMTCAHQAELQNRR